MEHSHRDLALAEHLRKLRVDRGQSLQDLATKSDISRATLSRIENGEVSPTAETLGRLATALALPISRLLAPLEQGFLPLVRHAEQSIWTDPGSVYSRRSLSPPSRQLQIEVIECMIGPNQTIAYEKPAIPRHEHHLVLQAGTLKMTIDGIGYALETGDCLRYRLRGASRFETGDEPARYILAMI